MRRKSSTTDKPEGYQKLLLTMFADAFRQATGEPFAPHWGLDGAGFMKIWERAAAVVGGDDPESVLALVRQRLRVAVELHRLDPIRNHFPPDAMIFAKQMNFYTTSRLKTMCGVFRHLPEVPPEIETLVERYFDELNQQRERRMLRKEDNGGPA